MNKNFTKASLFSRLMSFTYDSFLVVSFWFLNAFLVLFVFRFFSGNDDYANTPLGILVILATTIFYYIYFWSNGRTTLGMATWNHYLENDSGTPLSIFDSLKRFSLSFLTIPINFIWILFDKDKKCLADRILQIRLVKKISSS